MLGEDLQWSRLNQSQPIRLWIFQATGWGLLSDTLHVFRWIFTSILVPSTSDAKTRSWSSATSHSLTWPWDGHQLWIFTLPCSILPLTVNTYLAIQLLMLVYDSVLDCQQICIFPNMLGLIAEFCNDHTMHLSSVVFCHTKHSHCRPFHQLCCVALHC